MLNDQDYLEATRRFKNKKEVAHARQRYHALLLVPKGYSYCETAEILSATGREKNKGDIA